MANKKITTREHNRNVCWEYLWNRKVKSISRIIGIQATNDLGYDINRVREQLIADAWKLQNGK